MGCKELSTECRSIKKKLFLDGSRLLDKSRAVMKTLDVDEDKRERKEATRADEALF
jgi:hypothetical protein